MRLTERQAALIRQEVSRCFGTHSQVWLFGSRVDDEKKGGDIDLYIEPAMQQPEQLVEAKLRCLAALHRQLGEQKIDLVLRPRQCQAELPIHRIAKATGIRL